MKKPTNLLLSIILVFSLLLESPASAGIFSKPLIFLSKTILKKTAKVGVKQGVKTAAERQLAHATTTFGTRVVTRLERDAVTHSIPKERLLTELVRHADLYKKVGAGAALAFGTRNGQAGRYVLSRPDLYTSFQKAGGLQKGNERVVRESWRLVQGNEGSWNAVRGAVTAAEAEGTLKPPFSRDFLENLFRARVRAAGLQDVAGREYLPKGTDLISGHTLTKAGEPSRQGIDFLHLQKDRPVTLLEFGSGRKPSPPDELTEGRLRDRLATFIEQHDKTDLRGRGMPPELFNTERVRNDPHFPIHDFLNVLVCAPELGDLSSARRATRIPIHPVQLP